MSDFLENNDRSDAENQNNDGGNQSLLGGGQDQQLDQNNQEQGGENQPEVISSIDDYKVDVEGFNYDEFKAIPENQAFLERAKEAGLDNKTLNFALKEYNDIIQNVVGANVALDTEACITEMNQVWGGEADTNFKFAQAAANNAINNGILTAEEVNSPEFGNNPLVLKMAAYFGAQLQEDTPLSNTQQSGVDDVRSLLQSEAYLNSSHPDHQRVYAQVQKFYEKQNKG
ncbi:hypothetical protein B9T31_16005 [Acinetobacter sp. ANC 4558]|uniref:hypothetical protein n=1 Tax=Acinetobacter sp. ANC 4558 TaxID=1977876 RepID=UPI000A3419AC|nr:hypothetical protein [Acinetobacter sp. ANC 4558]OTG80802.1 hypothetical protein B9T31_16005 [Acinetobacter sp. ANC 4558]